MSATFTRTLRSLRTDRSHAGRIGRILSVLVLGAWTAWFCLGRVGVYEVAESARLEATGQARPIVPLVDGQVMRTELSLGKTVEAGDVLVQLDDRSERLGLEEGQTRINDLRAQLKAVEQEIEARQHAAAAQQKAAEVSLEEHRSRIAEAQAKAKFADAHLARLAPLVRKADVSEDEYSNAQADAEAKRAAVRTLQIGLAQLQEHQKVLQSDRQVELATLNRERAKFLGQLATEEATLAKLLHEVELRKIRAPISGRVGQLGEFPVGAAVKSGEELAFVVPVSQPRAVAFFPVAAAGRIRTGQPARLRLDGFSWTQYGSLPAVVTNVASEPHDGLLRVELEPQTDPDLLIPEEHGLPGSAEVTVDRIAPAALVLRSVGWLLRGNRSGGTDITAGDLR